MKLTNLKSVIQHFGNIKSLCVCERPSLIFSILEKDINGYILCVLILLSFITVQKEQHGIWRDSCAT